MAALSSVAIATAATAAAGSIASSAESSSAAGDAASAYAKAASQAEGIQQGVYNTTQTNLSPYISAGTNALSEMNAANSGDYSGFENSPDYKFSLQQGISSLDKSAAAKGSLYSAGHSQDMLGYASGLADQNYSNYYNRLASLENQGLSATNSLTSAGQNYANQYSNLLTGNAATQGDADIQKANAVNSGIKGVTSSIGSALTGSGLGTGASSYSSLGNTNLLSSLMGSYGTQSSYGNGSGFNLATAGTGVGY